MSRSHRVVIHMSLQVSSAIEGGGTRISQTAATPCLYLSTVIARPRTRRRRRGPTDRFATGPAITTTNTSSKGHRVSTRGCAAVQLPQSPRRTSGTSWTKVPSPPTTTSTPRLGPGTSRWWTSMEAGLVETEQEEQEGQEDQEEGWVCAVSLGPIVI